MKLLFKTPHYRQILEEGWFSYSSSIWPATILASVFTMHVLTLRALSLWSPMMTTSYSAMLFVHFSVSKSKPRQVACLCLVLDGAMIIVATLVPTWHHAPSHCIVHTISFGYWEENEGPIESTMKSVRSWGFIALLDLKVMLYSKNSADHLPILVEASRLLNKSPRLWSIRTLILCASKLWHILRDAMGTMCVIFSISVLLHLESIRTSET